MELFLEQIRDCQIIMIVHPVSNSDVARSHLTALQAHDDVGSDAVHQVTKIALVLADVSVAEIGVSIVLLPPIDIERQPGRNRHSNLGPSAGAVDGDDTAT